MEEHQAPYIGPEELFEIVQKQVPMNALYEFEYLFFIYNLPLHKLYTIVYQRIDRMIRIMKEK